MFRISFIFAVLFTPNLVIGESWQQAVPVPNVEAGYHALRWQTSFDEFEIGRYAPINSQGVVGVPGWPVMPFGYQMNIRYSEFELNFRAEQEGKQIKPYTLANFRQNALDGYLPAVVTEFIHQEIEYQITYMSCPGNPQPVDILELQMKNSGQTIGKSRLLLNIDGAPTLKQEGNRIEDRGKPLLVLEGMPEEICIVEREAGLVDPRCTPAGEGWLGKDSVHWRDGYYGMPIEYMLKADSSKEYQVYLGTDGTPQWLSFSRAYSLEEGHRTVELSAEGDQPITVDLNYPPGQYPRVHKFTGKDLNGDGYIKVSSRATPQSRQPAVLNGVWMYDADIEGIQKAELIARKPSRKPIYYIPVGANSTGPFHGMVTAEDPTWKGLSLRYTGELQPGEKRRYILIFPAIDRPEPMCYGNSYHPYDTGQSWMRNLQPRYPANPAAWGEDVPPDRDPAEYAILGPKPRALRDQQLQQTQGITPEKAKEDIKKYWDHFLSQRAKFYLPDQELDNLYKTQLAILHLYLLKWSEHDIHTQMCGPFYYWDMCLRDGSYQIRAWDMAGYHDIARRLCDSLLVSKSQLPENRWTLGQWDDPDNLGMWQTRGNQWDSQGQTLGALVDHYFFTGDKQWLKQAYPALAEGAKWIIRMRNKQKDSVGDSTNPLSGLFPTGHLEAGGSGSPFYLNAYGVYGLRQAALAAKELGYQDDSTDFLREAEDFEQTIRRAMQQYFVRLNDYCGTIPVVPEPVIPEQLDRLATWPSSSMVYPLEVLEPFDSLVEGWYRYKEAEAAESGGLMTFPYIFTDWAISYIRRGQPDRTVDLFNAYVDTSSPMLGWSESQILYHEFTEFDPPKIGLKGQGDMPHGEACSNYIIMLRNLLLHEERDLLHIAPATPRRWMAQSKPFGVEAAPTRFGQVSYLITPSPDRKTITAAVQLSPNRLPVKVLVHLRTPNGSNLQEVKVNDKNWDAYYQDTIILAPPPVNFVVTAIIN